MRVLLVVGHTDSLFSSGIAQQVAFTQASLTAAGIASEVASTSPPVAAYAQFGINTWQLRPDTRIADFDVVLFVSINLVASAPGSEPFLERLRADGVKIASMLCGNYFYLLQEQFVFRQHAADNLGAGLGNPYVDEYWALETYRPYRSFMASLLDRPVRILPYCWSDAVIQRLCIEQQLQPAYSPDRSAGLRIVIAEPNVSVHKSALVPLLVANRIMAERPDARVLVLGGQSLDHSLLAPLLRIYSEERVESYPRMSVMQVLHMLRESGHPVLFVCHHLSNGLNFLHFEITSLGYPVVHNSDELAATGAFYDGENVDAAVRGAMRLLAESTAARTERVAREQRALAWYSPVCDRVVTGYQRALTSLAGAHGDPS